MRVARILDFEYAVVLSDNFTVCVLEYTEVH